MKVLLINPLFENLVEVPGPEAIPELANVAPPLGLLYLAAGAERRSHTVEVLDANLEGLSPEQTAERIAQSRPDVVGITTTTFSLVDVLLAARAVKRASPASRIVLGGPHTALYPDETMTFPEVDFLILGEGDLVFPQLLEALAADSTDLSAVPNLVWRDNGRVRKNPVAPFISDLDSLPFPARHLVPFERYRSYVTREARLATMMSSRGCPYKCTFCNHQHMGGGFRPRSPQSVVAEMEECARMGFREIMFYDDTFTIQRKRVLDICDLVIARRLPVKWDIRARVNTLDEEVLDRLVEAGCVRLRIGVESGTPEILKILNKGIRLEDVARVFALARQRGMTTFAYFMIGNPTETREQIERTVEFAKAIRPDFVEFSPTHPCPGTELYEMALAQGVIREDYWREFARNPRPGVKVKLWEDVLTRDEILHLLDWAFKSFYSRPSYMLQRLSKIRSMSELYRQARAGMKLLLGSVQK
ncbi:MAG: B12-binding domain-containing radical SAM protein [Candidatus Sumerlaeia bacterium]|nr:B12-binding domain-containing radical SAM protein [Candidatus Sumerlaeia bacterium]